MNQNTSFRVLLDLGQLLTPMELENYRAKAAELGRDLRDHTIALLFGKDRIPPPSPETSTAGKSDRAA